MMRPWPRAPLPAAPSGRPAAAGCPAGAGTRRRRCGCCRTTSIPRWPSAPQDLVVYGGAGKAARNWEAYAAIVATLKRLGDDQTLLVQSGKPVGVFRTHEDAPRVLIANAHLVPRWATWDEFRRLEALGLTMYGQMTAGSWIYIGTQGILQGTYETFAALARQHFGGSLAGRLVVSAGLGGMGGAQPLAATMNGGVFLGVEVDPRAHRAPGGRRLLRPDGATTWTRRWRWSRPRARERAAAVGGPGGQRGRGAARAGPPGRAARRGDRSDVGPRSAPGLHPAGHVAGAGGAHARGAIPRATRRRCWTRWWCTCEAMLACKQAGAVVFDYGNNLRGQVADRRGLADAFRIPGFVPAYIRPLFCRGAGPFRWAALSGEAAGHRRHRRRRAASCSRKNEGLARWIRQARDKVKFQGLPARICWLEYGERAEAGRAVQLAGEEGQGGGAAGDRPRPPGHRLGRLAQPRDRGHARRIGRHRRLAAAERAAEHRLRGQLGVDSPRRRRGHRVFASTPAWWWWPTAPAAATIACNGC